LKLIKKIFGKKEEIPPLKSLKFDELLDWIETESEKTFSKLQPSIRQKYEEIDTALGTLSANKGQLQDARQVEGAYKRIEKAGASNRDNVIKNLNIILEKTRIPDDATPTSASEFYRDAKSTFKTCIENTIRSQQYVKALYPGEYQLVMEELSHLDTLLDELIAPVNEIKGKLDAYDRLPEEIESINQTRQQIKEKENEILNLEKKYDSSKHELQTAESELSGLVNSKELMRAQELEKQAEALKDQISSIDFNIKGLFTPLSKATLRMEKQDESGRHILSPESRNIVKMLKEDPVSVLGTDINPFLVEIRKRVEDGTLGLKEQKKNKTLEQIDRLAGTDARLTLNDQRKSYFSELDRILEELNGLTVYKEKTILEKQVSEYRSMIDSTEHDMELERKFLVRLKEETERSMTELNSNLRNVFGDNIEVSF
jgi:DNA repair exonuclease SbcCD ATPase subunit